MWKHAGSAVVLLLLGAIGGIAGARAMYALGVDPHADELRRVAAVLDLHRTEIDRLSGNDEALKTGLTKSIVDLGGRLYLAGLVDEKNENRYGWWCFDIHCSRTKAQCDLKITTLRSEWQSEASEATAESMRTWECVPTRIAYCQGRFCYGERSACLVMQSKNQAWPCLGVE